MERIFVLHRHGEAYAGEVVAAAMLRSFTAHQVQLACYEGLNGRTRAAVLIAPPDTHLDMVEGILASGGKALVLGQPGPRIAERLGLGTRTDVDVEAHWSSVSMDPDEAFNESPVAVRYGSDHPLAQSAVVNPRPLSRYDFADEWNNLGYGMIRCDGGPWAIAGVVSADEGACLGWLEDGAGRRLSAYASVTDEETGSALWINRAVGPVDSLEWQMVEAFFGDYRSADLPCYPYLGEIPWGYCGAVTMRLDCDQAVASARPLWELYQSFGKPLSLALLTGLELTSDDLVVLGEVISAGGSVVPHSVNHHPNWGGTYELALKEARDSMDWMERCLPHAAPVRFAVSPFHQNPVYAVKALAHAGYRGFVGGSIRNDPEFLLGRAGRVPFVEAGIVSHSQQCMLHGDCYRRYGQSLEVYQQSFQLHMKARAIFGYLDHPFSDAYQYGWDSEGQRNAVHAGLIRFIETFPDIWWCSLIDCLEFLLRRDQVILGRDDGDEIVFRCQVGGPDIVPAAWFKGECLAPRVLS